MKLPICEELVKETYKIADEFSKEHEWGITLNLLIVLAHFHFNGNDYSKMLVEDILEDCNFHTINKLIHEGKYIDAIQKFKDEFGYPAQDE